jgi:Lrp/AsnC family transcriptional regulator for asnA, asnC and gidA
MRLGQKPGHRVELDDIDRKIITLLQEDGRRPASDIARLIGTSVQTVSNRVERLVDNAVIDVMAILNPPSIGRDKDAIVCVRVRQGCLESVGDQLANLRCVSYVGFLAGSFDIMLEIYVEDDEHLFRFLAHDLAGIEGIEATETWTVLHTRKYNHAWENPLVPDAGTS